MKTALVHEDKTVFDLPFLIFVLICQIYAFLEDLDALPSAGQQIYSSQ